MNESKKNTRTEWIDPDDAPELTDDFFEEADEYYGNTLIRRGRASAQKRAVKKRISVHLSADVIGRFCAAGWDWEALINSAVSTALKRHSLEELSVGSFPSCSTPSTHSALRPSARLGRPYGCSRAFSRSRLRCYCAWRRSEEHTSEL